MKQSEKTTCVRLPKFFIWLGVVFEAVLLPIAWASYADIGAISLIFMLPLACLGLSLIVGYINCRIYYDDVGFTAKNFLGVKRRFVYDELTEILKQTHETYLYMGRRRVMVDEFAVGGGRFVRFAEKKYRELHGGRYIPKKAVSKRDIFNGNIEDGTAIFVIYMIMIALCIVCLVIVLINAFSKVDESSGALRRVVLEEARIRNSGFIIPSKTLHMTDTEGALYELEIINDGFDPEALIALCNGESEVEIYGHYTMPDGSEPYFSVYAVKFGENFVFSFDDYNAMQSGEAVAGVVIFVCFIVFFVVWLILSVIVGRNPERFSVRTRRLFFKDRAIRKK